MVSIIIRRDAAGRCYGYECRGHADYGKAGSDIVCAAVSMLSINTANAIEALTDTPITVTETDPDKGRLVIALPEGSNERSGLLMEAYELGIRGVMDRYNRNGTYVSLEIEEAG